MNSWYGTVLVDPDAFFREHGDEMSLRFPVAVVVVAGLISLVPTYLITGFLEPGGSYMGETAIQVAQVFGLLVGFVTVFVVWLFVTGLLHGLSAVLGAERGTFRRTFKLAGVGFIPRILSGALSAVATWYALQTLPRDLGPNELQAAMNSITVMQVVTVVSIVLLAWQGLIWTFAVRHSRGLSLRRSAIVAYIPAGGSILLTALSMF